MAPPLSVLRLWRAADAVCFDVDSTVCIDEGIDELAASLGKGKEVAAWTAKAMGGSMTFQEALTARLEIMKPTRQQLDRLIAQRPPAQLLTPGVAELIRTLRARGTAVYLISGGFTQMIHPVAAHLGLPRDHVIANTILFSPDGAYAGFDQSAPTSRSGGKPKAIAELKRRFGYHTIAMIGDGATDLEARCEGAADLMIGFGGIQVREKVKQGADWFVTSFDPLISALRPQAAL
eukprot:TRINITY_DN16763_c0_g1_i1.p1 TRINITY_DN16763_c0_g1~~TRINITY_DN16763_c0_g1_i1.p1  ORF type:complete len:234 (+),score=78.40 TRINITY_DN16763_c0_g1_i1:82-783(+)